VKVGNTDSITVMLNVHLLVALLPELVATAVQTTLEMPVGKLVPLGGTQLVTVSLPPQFGTAKKIQFIAVEQPLILVVRLPGQEVIVGNAFLESTITLKVEFVTLPEASTAVQVTVLLPSGKTEPLGGEQLLVTPEQSSLAVGDV
jgi:hypothetical protein